MLTYCGDISIWSPAAIEHRNAPVCGGCVDSNFGYSEGASTTDKNVASTVPLT
jgi:hypothetical protein